MYSVYGGVLLRACFCARTHTLKRLSKTWLKHVNSKANGEPTHQMSVRILRLVFQHDRWQHRLDCGNLHGMYPGRSGTRLSNLVQH